MSTKPLEITFVKKVLADGTSCRKCGDVEQRLHRSGWHQYIDRVVTADEADPESEGMRLAAEHAVERAPFFVVQRPDGKAEIHTVYLRLVREVLEPAFGDPASVAA